MKFLLAVSGGIDSMYLANRAPEHDGPFAVYPGPHSFAVAHCNFSLRGEESDGDEAFVRNWCRTKGLECFVRRFDTLGYAASRGISTEMAARELRYGWFAELVAEGGFDALAVAHNANDNAETLILNLLRGTGSRGLRGIAADSQMCIGPGPSPLTAKELPMMRVIRPMLKIERAEILNWMETKGFEWREDHTNSESLYKRNIIRNEIFPILEKVNPSYLKTLGENMERFSLVDDIAEDYFISFASTIDGHKNSEIPVNELLELKGWKYILWRFLEDSEISYPTFGKLTTLLEKYRKEPRGTVTLSGKTFETPTSIISVSRPKLSNGPILVIKTRK